MSSEKLQRRQKAEVRIQKSELGVSGVRLGQKWRSGEVEKGRSMNLPSKACPKFEHLGKRFLS